MLIYVNTSIAATAWDLILVQNFHYLTVPWEKIIFGVDMSSSVHVDNKGKEILILGEGPTQGLDDTTLSAGAKYPIDFTQSGKRSVLRLHCNGSNSFLFVNATKVYQFKAKNSEIKDYALCLGNISKDFTINSMKKQDFP